MSRAWWRAIPAPGKEHPLPSFHPAERIVRPRAFSEGAPHRANCERRIPNHHLREGTDIMTLGFKTTPETVAPVNTTPRTSRRLFNKRLAGLIGGGALAVATGFSTPQKTSAAIVDGQNIAQFALQFVGYPYVWAGNTPAGFDCSGFTQYVYGAMLGIDITHSTGIQAASGAWVDWGTWMPGDLVSFAGTWGPGITHVGIYIGDGQFVHAENETTGVTISSLYSDYYGGHYYGAVRLA